MATVEADQEHDFSIVAEVEFERKQLLEEADALLVEITKASRRATDGELAWFNSQLRWSERQTREELRRMSNVLRLRGIAGSPADRAAASVEAEVAATVLAKEQPKLQAKIDELTAKLRSLDADARLSAKRQADQAEAVEGLRALAPQHIREAVQHRESELAHGIGKRLSDVEIRLNEIECCLTPDKYPDEASWLETLERSCRDAVERVLTGQFIRRRKSDKWPAIQAELQAERARLLVERDQLKAEISRLEALIREQLDYYTRGEKDDQ